MYILSKELSTATICYWSKYKLLYINVLPGNYGFPNIKKKGNYLVNLDYNKAIFLQKGTFPPYVFSLSFYYINYYFGVSLSAVFNSFIVVKYIYKLPF